MIYECAVVAKSELASEQLDSLKELVRDVVKSFDGEIFIEDDWGNRTLAQATSKGVKNANYLYFMYRAGNDMNVELNRRFKINEAVIKSMVIQLSETDDNAGEFVKNFKSPFSKKYSGSVTDEDEEGSDVERDRRKFSRRKNCWFSAKKITADWKDPKTFSWLVNEFGKISPARVSGISRKHQRFAEVAIKRARNMGIISHLSNRIME
jgi:ribosomal protein S18/ribosomal protein S6